MRGVTWEDRIRNETIREDLQIFALIDKISKHRNKWKEHLNRMPLERFPHQVLEYKPKGRREVGRPRQRSVDQ